MYTCILKSDLKSNKDFTVLYHILMCNKIWQTNDEQKYFKRKMCALYYIKVNCVIKFSFLANTYIFFLTDVGHSNWRVVLAWTCCQYCSLLLQPLARCVNACAHFVHFCLGYVCISLISCAILVYCFLSKLQGWG